MKLARTAAFAGVMITTACTLIVDTDDLHRPSFVVDAGDGTVAPTPPLAEAGTEAGADAETGAPDLYRQEVLSDGPASFWRLAEATGGTAADEQNVRSGTYVGVTLGLDGPAAGHPSVFFDGTSSYVEISTPFTISGSAPLTVEAWVRPEKRIDNDCRHVFSQEDRGPPKRGMALLYYKEGTNDQGTMFERYVADDNVNTRQGDPIRIAEETWAYVAGVYDGSTLKLYVDGQLVQSGTQDVRVLETFTTKPYLGAGSPTPTDCHWHGRLAEIAVYEKALIPGRISAHFKAMPR